MRSAALLGALLLTLVACGGESDEEQVERAVTTYLDAFADRDGEEACEQLAFGAQFELFGALLIEAPLEAGKLVPAGDDVSDEEYRRSVSEACPKVVEKVTGQARGSQLDELRFAEVTDVRIEGDRAFARIAGATQVPTLEKVDGNWKITKLGIDFSQLGLGGGG
jgi:hypothetical protein